MPRCRLPTLAASTASPQQPQVHWSYPPATLPCPLQEALRKYSVVPVVTRNLNKVRAGGGCAGRGTQGCSASSRGHGHGVQLGCRLLAAARRWCWTCVENVPLIHKRLKHAPRRASQPIHPLAPTPTFCLSRTTSCLGTTSPRAPGSSCTCRWVATAQCSAVQCWAARQPLWPCGACKGKRAGSSLQPAQPRCAHQPLPIGSTAAA